MITPSESTAPGDRERGRVSGSWTVASLGDCYPRFYTVDGYRYAEMPDGLVTVYCGTRGHWTQPVVPVRRKRVWFRPQVKP